MDKQEKQKNSNYERETTDSLKASILRVLAFFDLFDYPLTPMEIWQGMDLPCSFERLETVLQSGVNRFNNDQGLYFLVGRKENVSKRLASYNLYNKKLAQAKKTAKYLRYVPGVKMLSACNNFSYSEDSDVDVFIIVKKDRMWLTRFLVTLVLQLAGIRRHGKKVKNRICLSFYVTESALDLSPLLLKSQKNIVDPYFTYWMNDLLPLYGEKSFEKFWQDNSWLEKELPNAAMPVMSPRFCVKDNFSSLFTKKIFQFFVFSMLAGKLEKISAQVQKKKMTKNKKSVSSVSDSRVVISDEVLKFHEKDRRQEYHDKWLQKVNEVTLQ